MRKITSKKGDKTPGNTPDGTMTWVAEEQVKSGQYLCSSVFTKIYQLSSI